MAWLLLGFLPRRSRVSHQGSIVVEARIADIDCRIEGEQRGASRCWHTVRSARTGMLYPPELLGLQGWLDVELRAEAELPR